MERPEDKKRIFDILSSLIDAVRRKKDIQFADARAVVIRSSSIVVQDGKAEKIFYTSSSGVAIRVLVGGAWGFASCDGFDRYRLSEALEKAVALAKGSSGFVADPAVIAAVEGSVGEAVLEGRFGLEDISLADKQKKALELERAAYKDGEGKIVNSIVSYADGVRSQWVVNTLGSEVYSRITRARLACQLTAVEGDIRQRAYQVVGGQCGPEILLDTEPEDFTIKACRKVLNQLRARKSPAGEFPVIFSPMISGLLAHEALGHNAEADSIWSGQSILQGKLGQRIASELVTIVDDPTIEGKYGSELFDSEAVPTQRKVIVDRGVFVQPLHTLETAARFGMPPNGSARAQDHHSSPICRMSNTFFAPGNSTLEEMIRSIDKGIYLKEGHEGYVYPERGQFLCHANEAYLIENGQIKDQLRDVSVSGLILETLMNIDMVGDDLVISSPGSCGKSGQSIPVDCGGPHLRVARLVVGGENTK